MKRKINNLNINYLIEGDGEKYVVILEGWGTNVDVYKSIRDILKVKYKVLTIDLPGFGESEEMDKPWSVDDYCDFLEDFLNELNIKEAILIGHSYGGRMIIKLNNRENLAFKITKEVIIDGAGIKPKMTVKKAFKIYTYKILKLLLLNKVVHFLFPEIIEDWKRRQGSNDYRNATPIMRDTLVKSVNEDLSKTIKNIKTDTLLIWGDKDTATPIIDGYFMEKEMENVGLVVLEGAGHYSFLEKPEEFKRVLESYLL